MGKVTKGKRPEVKEIPSDVPREIIKLMKKCWDGNQKKRPQFEEILKQVSAFYQAYEGQLREADTELNISLDKVSGIKLEARGEAKIGKKSKSSGAVPKKKNPSSGTPYDIGEWEKERVIGDDKLRAPVDITLNESNDDIVVVDKAAKCVFVFNAEGKYRFSIKGKSRFSLNTTQKLDTPWGVVYISGKYFVTDLSAYVRCYNADDGQYCDRWLAVKPGTNVGHDNAWLLGICMDTKCNVLVGNYKDRGQYISKHTADGNHINSFNVGISPFYLAVTSDDNIIISSGYPKYALQIANQHGSLQHRIQYPGMSQPRGVCCHSDVIYVCQLHSANILCLTQDGKHIGTIPIADAQQSDRDKGSRCVSVRGDRMMVCRYSIKVDGSYAGRVEMYARLVPESSSSEPIPSQLEAQVQQTYIRQIEGRYGIIYKEVNC
ncbi:uncharacterized protein [Amphiura filiformis]|uniref:uncharacterized protein n=1 Tax=Amphiura filiformis TaxID=82378 RepID=UPI003B21C692